MSIVRVTEAAMNRTIESGEFRVIDGVLLVIKHYELQLLDAGLVARSSPQAIEATGCNGAMTPDSAERPYSLVCGTCHTRITLKSAHPAWVALNA